MNTSPTRDFLNWDVGLYGVLWGVYQGSLINKNQLDLGPRTKATSIITWPPEPVHQGDSNLPKHLNVIIHWAPRAYIHWDSNHPNTL